MKKKTLENFPAVLKVETWPISRIIPYKQNARKIPALAIQKVAASLREFGWRQPIVVDRDGIIVVGHARRLAAIDLGWTDAPVHVALNLTAAQIRAFRIADNRTHEEAKWDFAILAAELKDLAALGVDLAATAFSDVELANLLTVDGGDPALDHVDAPPAVAVTRPGDLWQLGPHRLICGDATNADDVARVLGQARPLLMVTDPPYGIGLDLSWRRDPKQQHDAITEKARPRVGKANSIAGDLRVDWSDAFALVPSLQVAYVWFAAQYTRETLNGLEAIGFGLHQQLIWDKGRAPLMRTHYWYQHDPCWYVRKKNAPWYGKPGDNTTVWRADSPKVSKSEEDKQDHPNQKPIALMKKSILNHTRKGEGVYEPFSGSGTTLAAAEVTGRVCFAIEIDPRFCDVTLRRWQTITGKAATLAGGRLKRTFAAIQKERLHVS